MLISQITTAFSILEIVTASLSRGRPEKRKKYAWLSGILIFIVGLPSALSFGVLTDVTINGLLIFDFADYVANNFGLPLGALLISLFVGFRLKKEDVFAELEKGANGHTKWMHVWYFLIKVLAPLAIIAIFLQSLEII